MTLLEECCKRIINERKIQWFSIRHAKVLTTLKKYNEQATANIALITNTEKQTISQTLQELKNAKLITFNGEAYCLQNEIETLQKLMQMAEKQEIKIMAKSK